MPLRPTITARLKDWGLDQQRSLVSGFVYKSKNRVFRDGDIINALEYISCTEYDDCFIIKTYANIFELLKTEAKV